MIKHRLYRQHTSIIDDTTVKDLSKLGRDMKRILIVDNIRDNFRLQPDNGVEVRTWIGDEGDTLLLTLKKFLGSLYFEVA
mmetsp:Transcript_241/g.145  ORF Transcript_241/g.145 Transcript_241/m.145 type:complete len:80 (+) Transcript_241:490-729(+)